jgi:hypothetical protein
MNVLQVEVEEDEQQRLSAIIGSVRDLDVCWFASDLLGKEIEKERFNASINNVFTLRAKTKPIGRQQ